MSATDAYLFSEAGDIAFVREDDWLSRLIVFGQKLLGRRGARFSHALLCVAPCIWVQATPETGVSIHPETEFFDGRHYEDVLVVRLPQPEPLRGSEPLAPNALGWRSKADAIKLWTASFFYFHQQGYDFSVGFLRIGTSRARYCSELVAEVYKRCRPGVLPILGQTRIFPDDLMRLAIGIGGEDITELFKRGLEISVRLPPTSISVEEIIRMNLDMAEFQLGVAMDNILVAKTRASVDVTVADLGINANNSNDVPMGFLTEAELISWKTENAVVRARNEIKQLRKRKYSMKF